MPFKTVLVSRAWTYLLSLALPLAFIACGGGGGGGGGSNNGPALTAPVANFTGTWDVVETTSTNTCPDSPPLGTQTLSSMAVTHATGSNTCTLTSNGQSYTGTISGATLTYSGTAANPDCPQFNVTVHLDFQAPDYTTATGYADWTCGWSGGSCKGRTNLTVTKEGIPPPTPTTDLIQNGGFESGSTNWTWTASIGTVDNMFWGDGNVAHGGTHYVWMGGWGAVNTTSLYQTVTIPSNATSASLNYWLLIWTAETGTTIKDTAALKIRDVSENVLETPKTYSNLDAPSYAHYAKETVDLIAYKGMTIQVYFTSTEDAENRTNFFLDDVSLVVQ